MTNVHKLFWDLPVPLQDQIASITTNNPTSLDTFTQICDFYRTQAGIAKDAPGSPKKRKITTSETNGSAYADNDDDAEVDVTTALTIKNLSVSLPVRKKLDLLLTPTQLVARAPNSNTPEFVLDYRHDRVEAAFLLEVPEKTKPQWNLIVAFTRKDATTTSSFDYFQATLLEDTIKNVVKPVSGEQYLGSIKEMVILYFQRREIPIISHETIDPSDTLFQATAHRGSKDGLLYFLPGYIFFGFKKPLVLFRLENILAVSYSSITRSTFNIIIKYIDPITQDEASEIEFSIIDQIHYDKINRFVTENQLHNDSMAETRRAKIDTKAQFPTELGKAHAEQQAVSAAAAVEATDGGPQGLGILDNDFDNSDEEDEDFNSDTKEDNSDSDNESEDGEEDDDEEEDEEEEL